MNTDFLRNRLHVSGYGVTLHTSAWMGESTFRTKQAALEAAQTHVLRASAHGSAVVFPRRSRTMIFNHRRILCVTYTVSNNQLQFTTYLPC